MNRFKKFQDKSLATLVKEYVIISVGILIYTAGWAVFLAPNNLIGGGVSGISAIIQYATGIKMGYSYFVLNSLLLLISIFIVGPSFGAKSVYAIVLASLSLNLLQDWIPTDFVQTFAVANGPLLCSIIAGAIVGLGIGMSISQGGSSGGTDIVAMIINKYKNISPGRLILVMDVIIIASSLLVPSYAADGRPLPFVNRFTIAAYGMIFVTICGNVIDLYLAGSKQSMQLLILSKKYEEIADVIATQLHRGVTVLNGKGWYSKQDVSVLMVLTRKTDVNILLRYIKMIDPDVFLSITPVTGVYGRGFDAIKGNRKAGKHIEEKDV